MANYQTHKNIGIASTTISILILAIFKEDIIKLSNYNFNINIIDYILMFTFGILGSLAPDLDLKTSTPTNILRKTTYLTSTITFSLFYYIYHNNIQYNDDIKTIIYISSLLIIIFIINFIIDSLYKRIKHRGVVHSIPFAILSSILISDFILYINVVFNLEINIILSPLLFFIGFITHLILDEMYSVDLYNKRLKKSFGSAFKFFDKKNKLIFIILYTILTLKLFLIFS